MKQFVCFIVLAFIIITGFSYGNGGAEAAGSASRGRYLAGEGLIIPPEEVIVESYIAQVDYQYPVPSGEVGLSLYTANHQIPGDGSPTLLHIGIQGEKKDWETLPPMNLAFVIDISASMAEENKIEWVKSAFDLFLEQVRPVDFVSVVAFSDVPEILFESRRIDNAAAREAFRSAVHGLNARGGSDLEAGLKAGYAQIMRNYRSDYTNRVLFLSDGTEISSRLSRAGGQTGEIRATLMWNNRNDLDLHMITPTGEEIFYGNSTSASGGQLDVDANVDGSTTKPVENIFWPFGSRPPEGPYEVFVRNFAYHEEDRRPTEFTVELKSGSEVSRFQGTTPYKTGGGSDVVAFRFNYAQDTARKAEIYQIAEQYRGLGVSVTTIGVGTGFDLDFMNTLAIESGGSSRFIADRREMEEIFGPEFDRMILSAARELEVELRFLAPVEIQDTWGYDHEVEGSILRFSLPTLHARDYETILVRYAPEAGEPPGDVEIAEVSIVYQTLTGERKRIAVPPAVLRIVETEKAVSGYSNGVVLRSGTILNFAEGLIDIGNLYYGAMDSMDYDATELSDDSRKQLEEALRRTRVCRAELENAALRLDDEEIFADEQFILVNYEKTLLRDLDDTRFADDGEDDSDSGTYAAVESVAGYLPPLPSGITVEAHIKHLVDEILLGFRGAQDPVVAVAGITPGSESSSTLIGLINNGLSTTISSQSDFTVVERLRLESILDEQNLGLSGLVDTDTAVRVGNLAAAEFIVTGSVIETTESVIVFVRIVNVESGVVESAAQTIIPRSAA